LIFAAVLSDSASNSQGKGDSFKTIATKGLLTLLGDFLGLNCDLERSFLCFNLLVIFHEVVRDLRLGNSYRDYFNARRPLCSTLGKGFSKHLIQSIKFVDKNLLQRVFTAELINFVAKPKPCEIVLAGRLTEFCRKSTVYRS
jgi:hypothetical protein